MKNLIFIDIYSSRLQNIAITVDKARLCLTQEGQTQSPPLYLLSDSDAINYLWSSENSIIKRTIKSCLHKLLTKDQWRCLRGFKKDDILAFMEENPNDICAIDLLKVLIEEDDNDAMITTDDIRKKFHKLEQILRIEDKSILHFKYLFKCYNYYLIDKDGLFMPCADVMYLYANTKCFFAPSKNFKGNNFHLLKTYI